MSHHSDQRNRADYRDRDREPRDNRNIFSDRDRRRESSDVTHGNDRERGPTDRYQPSDSRDRRREREPDRSSMAIQSPSEPLSAVSGISAFGPPSAPRSMSSTAQDVSKALRAVKDVELTLVQLNYEEYVLNHRIQKEESEYQSTTRKNGEYPALKEMHQKNVHRQRVKREDILKRRKPVEEQYRRLTDNVAQTLVTALPAMAEKREAQKSVDPAVLEQLQKLQSRVESMSQATERADKNYGTLEKKQREMEESNKTLVKRVNDLEQENKTLKEQSTPQHKLKEQVAGQSKLIGSSFEKAVATEKKVGEMDKKVGEMEASLKKEKADRESAVRMLQDLVNNVRNTMSSLEALSGGQKVDIDKQANDLTTLRQTLEKHQQRLDSVNGTVQTLSTKQDTDIKSVRQSQTEHGQTQAELQKRVASTDGTVQALSSKQESMAASISTLDKTTKAQAGTLSSLEIRSHIVPVQSRSAERSTGSPVPDKVISDLQTGIDSVRNSVGITDQKLEANTTKLSGVDGRLRAVETNFPTTFGRLIMNLQNTVNNLPNNAPPVNNNNNNNNLQNNINAVNHNLQNNITAVDSRVTTQKQSLDTLVPQVQVLNDKSDSVQTAVTSLKDQYESLQMAFISLQKQYEQLTTKELADVIIGHLQQFVPNAQQVLEDVEAMVAKVNGFDDSLEQKVEQKVEKMYDQLNSNAQGVEAILMQGSDRVATRKRRRDAEEDILRLRDSVNGHHGNGLVNGHRSASANSGH